MKSVFLFIIFFFNLLFTPIEGSSYLLSSESLVQEKQGSLKDLHSFVFFPLVQGDEKKIRAFMHKELEQIGTVITKPALTATGADLESFSNPSLQFTIVQLVDSDNKPLAILKASLSVNSIVEILRNKELNALSTNRWCTYLEKTDNVEKVVKKAFPLLLKKFTTEYQKINGQDKKPTFYITYDEASEKQ